MMKQHCAQSLIGFLSLPIFFLLLSFQNSQAQGEITDEDLKNYAIVMDSLEAMKINVGEEIEAMIKENEVLDGGRVFNEIKEIGEKDTEKLKAEGITEEQIAAYQEIQKTKDKKLEEIKGAFIPMVKEMIGAGPYNSIKKALKNDEDVKARYAEIEAEVKAARNKEGE